MTTLAGRARALARRFDAVVEALAAGLAEALGVPLVPGRPVAGRERAGGRARRDKYGTEAWTAEGRLPDGVTAAGAPAGARS